MKPPISLATLIALAMTPFGSALEVDPHFTPQISGTVHAITVDREGRIIAGGEFGEVNGMAMTNLVRLTPSGVTDDSFVIPALDGAVLALAKDSGGSIAIGGAFSSPAPSFIRLLATGESDPAIEIGNGPSGRINCLAVAPGDSLILGGPFLDVDHIPSPYVTRIRLEGRIDPGFSCGLERSFTIEAGADALAVQPDGKVLVGGRVNTASGAASLVRLAEDGSVDDSFSEEHGAILYVKSLAVLADGRIVVAGVADSSGEGFVRRLNPDGTIDDTFEETRFDGAVEVIALDHRGRILAGGTFSGKMARLGADGAVEMGINLSLDGLVKAIHVEEDGSVLIGGAFSRAGGVEARGLARLVDKEQIAAMNSGRFTAGMRARNGARYQVEASRDLRSWTPFAVAIADAAGITVNEEGSLTGQKFFRLRALD